ncbi:xylulokinase [Breznakia pachnodae]|uniref:Sugar (Pentulose or hexulose) kinase n=1 Tax=Breznakia pachnodae TaxID=265178 RepID=A0ABU0E8G8_9FIRM|nr:FGGY-family carbohydrate kinase [Breznakia pachnodae]MDQ0363189.1 sugar (pentulose or hexulose) kinase [Breznakia pachnodae]
MSIEKIKEQIIEGEIVLGIELGSTRIKAVLIDVNHTPIAKGNYEWKSQYINDIFTYSLDDIWKGIQSCYKSLKDNVKEEYGVIIRKIASIGISGMMHGYMVFDKDDRLLVPFRTWQNTTTECASKKLTKLFDYKIPQRWCISHLYQAILNDENHVENINYMTTLSGYIHYKLTGNKVVGVGEASGMFPIDLDKKNYNNEMINAFDNLVKNHNYNWKIKDILPKVLLAGELAGTLTLEGSLLLDNDGDLQSGCIFCPPEGDAGTGMVATNTISERSCNISAGTSIFSMVVIEKELSRVYEELDLVMTPDGKLVTMVHVNNCTSDLNEWMDLFSEVLKTFGVTVQRDYLYEHLFKQIETADMDNESMLLYNFLSGEHILQLVNGCPLFVRSPNSNLSLSNFMKVQLYSTICVLKLGMDLLQEEGIKIDYVLAHGGLFKTRGVVDKIVSSALNVPVSLMETANEGGAWGMAILASYIGSSQSLESYLNNIVFSKVTKRTINPDLLMMKSYNEYAKRYTKGLPVVKLASQTINKEF